MRRLTLLAALLISAVAAGDAAAKEVVGVKVCGPADCRASRDPDVIRIIENGAMPSIALGEKAPWYRVLVRMRIEGASDEHFAMVFVPRARMMRTGETPADQWMMLSRTDARELSTLARGLRPFAARKLRGTDPGSDVTEASGPGASGGGSAGSGSGGSGAGGAGSGAAAPAAATSPSSDGGPSPLVWIGGALVLAAGVLALVLRLRRPRPSAG